MKITDVKTILLTGPCTLDPYLSEARKLRSAAFIQIKTDSGLIGIGETYAGYFCPEMVPEVVEFFKPILVGNNVDDIPGLWAKMYHCGNFWCRVGLGAIVLCGIEAALWDLKGKHENMPVWKLLQEKWRGDFGLSTTKGAYHDKLPCYATGGPSNYPLDKLAGKIEFYQSCGFKGAKIGAGAYYKDKGFNIPSDANEAADLESEKMAYIRKQFGDDLWLMMDAHMGNSSTTTWGLDTAMAVAKAMEPYKLFFLEEPLHYTRPDLYSELCKNTTTPIAGGECLTAYCEWQTFLEQDSFNIGQPDASFTAGLNEFMKVTASLHQRGRKIAPHAWGAGASQMQNIHCGFASPNTIILEVAPAYGPLHSELISDSLQMKDGYALPPEKPGLGIELTEATIKRYPFQRGSGEFNSVSGKILTT
ncbi:MAG: mandelate racemase/muconate lactonizing enzyme family protein [Bacteroidota bacterium]